VTAERLGVRDKVAMRDAVAARQLPDVYRDHDVLVFPTVWDEPSGLVPLEAMATGCVVVATGTGGSAEYLEEERNCLTFAVQDADAAATQLARLVSDEQLVERLRVNGYATAAGHDFATYARELEALVQELIGMPIR
jgi:glycosyltransferase involved in cell wall biosynthesis